MKSFCVVLAALVGAASSATPIYAATNPKFSFPVARAPHRLAIDPSLSDPAWTSGRVPDGGGPWENLTTRGPATQPTTAYLLYDDHFLYVAFRAEQARTPIVATQTTHDVGFGIDDFVGIGLDTSGGGSAAYYFETTPLGTRYEQANENVRYRPQWQSAARVDPGSKGWNAVFAIPLSALKIQKSGLQPWRVQFVRQIAARGEHYVWSYAGIMTDGPSGSWPTFADSRFWASTTGIDLAIAIPRPSGRVDPYGLLSAGGNRNLFEQANGEFLPTPVREYGIDLSYPLTPTVSFVGTANPDFSNVEIDQQTIAPQEFRRQLMEYRPFFAQGANFINASSGSRTPVGPVSTAPDLVFYSPDIGPFDWGTKVEGTYGLQSFGALTFRGFDQTTGNTFSDQAYGYQHALPDGSFILWSDGALAHHSLAGNDSTIESGVEGRNYNSGMIYFADYAFETGSWVPQGHADLTELFVDQHKTNYEVLASYLDISPNYNPIDGYTSNSDIRGLQGIVNLLGSFAGVKNWTVSIDGDRFLDESNAVHQADTQIFLSAVFKNGFSLDGAGQVLGQLRTYGIPAGPGCSGAIVAQSSFTGYPCYRDGVTSPYNLAQIPIGYGDGTPSPIDASYNWGPFGSNYVHLFTLTTTRPITQTMSLGLTYDGTYERPLNNGSLNSQWLRAISLGINLGPESSL
ncbi:MAG: hypothetical protein JO092_02855, partial [Candidatus Eremiobacteraeota bacterium]|nr:hypothetical protein [Candidatus Eremiobacteraeota bacterium]